MANAWLAHLKQFRKKNSGLQFKELLQQARKSYQGGGDPVPDERSNLASRSAKVGGDPVAAEVKSLATRSAKLGGSRRKSRRRQTRKSRRN